MRHQPKEHALIRLLLAVAVERKRAARPQPGQHK
jgi:hypothetical protein